MDNPKIRIVNSTALGKFTNIYLIKEDGTEIDISRLIFDCKINCNISGVVTADLKIRVDKVDVMATVDPNMIPIGL